MRRETNGRIWDRKEYCFVKDLCAGIKILTQSKARLEKPTIQSPPWQTLGLQRPRAKGGIRDGAWACPETIPPGKRQKPFQGKTDPLVVSIKPTFSSCGSHETSRWQLARNTQHPSRIAESMSLAAAAAWPCPSDRCRKRSTQSGKSRTVYKFC